MNYSGQKISRGSRRVNLKISLLLRPIPNFLNKKVTNRPFVYARLAMPLQEIQANSCQFIHVGPKRTSSTRVPSYHKLRGSNSQPLIRLGSPHVGGLRHKGSRLDLLDHQNITSFPRLAFSDQTQLYVIENYFPESPAAIHEPLNVHISNSWSILLHKKLRWRWRIEHLIH